VTPQGEVSGQLVADGTLRDIAELLRSFEPQPMILLHRVPVPGTNREVIVLEAQTRADLVPFAFEGRPYERLGSTVAPMAQTRYQELLLNRMHSQHRWENMPAPGLGVGDLDTEEILRTARLGIAAGRMPEATASEPGEILDRLGLRVGGQLIRAAVVAFGRRFLPDYPQCQLKMARFRGADKTEFVDQRQIHGHGFLLLEESMSFLRRHLPVAGRIQPGIFERIDEPLFPVEALREALVNAFCHRDYSYAGGAVSLAVFDDRLEIWSDGGLPFGITVEDLKRDHLSRPRNPLLAEVFFRRGLVERWGRGTQKIVELCTRAGHPEPEFVEQNATVGVRFLPRGYTAPYRVSHDLTERQREILQALAGRDSTSLRVLRTSLAETPAQRTLQADLAHLRRLGLVEASGRGRGASYRLIREK
jgi:ATP-dependent DNA helicase RecG